MADLGKPAETPIQVPAPPVTQPVHEPSPVVEPEKVDA